MISYEPFFNTLKRRNISQYSLIKSYGVSGSLLTRMRHNKNISSYNLDRLCTILKCEIKDVMVYVSDADKQEKQQ